MLRALPDKIIPRLGLCRVDCPYSSMRHNTTGVSRLVSIWFGCLCSRIIFSRQLMHHAASTCCLPLSQDLVESAAGLVKGGFLNACVHTDGLCTISKMSTYCRKEPGSCFPSCILTSQPEGARVPKRIKTVICVRRLYTYMSISMVFSPTD